MGSFSLWLDGTLWFVGKAVIWYSEEFEVCTVRLGENLVVMIPTGWKV